MFIKVKLLGGLSWGIDDQPALHLATSNIIGRGMLAAMVPGQFLRFFCETVNTHYIREGEPADDEERKKREERNRKQREYRARKRAEETTEQREERNRKQREYRARKKNTGNTNDSSTPDHGICNLIMYTILLCLCIEMSNTLNFYTPRTM